MSNSHSVSTTTQQTDSRRLVAIIGAAVIGVSLLYAAGFAHSSILHNAAHDVRHSAAFPCH